MGLFSMFSQRAGAMLRRRPVRLRFRSSYAGHALPRRSGVAAPRAARQGEAWRPGLDLNQDKQCCTTAASKLPPPGRGDHCWLFQRPLRLLL